MRNYLAAILFLCVFVSAQAQHDQGGSPPASKTNDTFNLIKALVGDWEGSYEWIGKNRKGPMNASYYLTGNGTAVVEDLIVDGNANMTAVYHLDGADQMIDRGHVRVAIDDQVFNDGSAVASKVIAGIHRALPVFPNPFVRALPVSDQRFDQIECVVRLRS